MEGKLRIVELFAGIGAQAMALEQLGIPFESTVCEIDNNAYKAYCAIHGDTPNLGDITKVEHLPDCDLMTYSFPCQDLSVAGKRKGMSEGSGTRSSLLWEVSRLLMDAIERERAGISADGECGRHPVQGEYLRLRAVGLDAFGHGLHVIIRRHEREGLRCSPIQIEMLHGVP